MPVQRTGSADLASSSLEASPRSWLVAAQTGRGPWRRRRKASMDEVLAAAGAAWTARRVSTRSDSAHARAHPRPAATACPAPSGHDHAGNSPPLRWALPNSWSPARRKCQGTKPPRSPTRQALCPAISSMSQPHQTAAARPDRTIREGPSSGLWNSDLSTRPTIQLSPAIREPRQACPVTRSLAIAPARDRWRGGASALRRSSCTRAHTGADERH